MDDFKKAQCKEIGIAGLKCPCCSPIANKHKSREKKKLHRRARRRLKHCLKNDRP
jgi:hypothetical protein